MLTHAYDSLVPRLLPVFQCCTLKNGRTLKTLKTLKNWEEPGDQATRTIGSSVMHLSILSPTTPCTGTVGGPLGIYRGVARSDPPQGWGFLRANIRLRFRRGRGTVAAPRVLSRDTDLLMAEIADPEEKRALVSLKDRSRVVNFRGGLDKLLSAIRVCFADILGSHAQTDILLQVHF